MNGKTQLIILVCFIYLLGIFTGYAYSQAGIAEQKFRTDVAKDRALKSFKSLNYTNTNNSMLFNYTNISLNISKK